MSDSKRNMKFSEAILKGCLLSEPGYLNYIQKNNNKLCACVIGAASVAYHDASEAELFKWENKGVFFIENTFHIALDFAAPIDTLPVPMCTMTGYPVASLYEQITLLNDRKILSREEIAKGLAEAGY